jgi:hypothetical protein
MWSPSGSGLIYRPAKRACFRELARVPAPGGRLSLYEPSAGSRMPSGFRGARSRRVAEAAGFGEITLTLTMEIRPADPVRWDVFLRAAR